MIKSAWIPLYLTATITVFQPFCYHLLRGLDTLTWGKYLVQPRKPTDDTVFQYPWWRMFPALAFFALAEEAVFRLVPSWMGSSALVIVASSAFFALVHGEDLRRFPLVQFLAGLWYWLGFALFGLWVAAGAHFIYNSVIALAVLVYRRRARLKEVSGGVKESKMPDLTDRAANAADEVLPEGPGLKEKPRPAQDTLLGTDKRRLRRRLDELVIPVGMELEDRVAAQCFDRPLLIGELDYPEAQHVDPVAAQQAKQCAADRCTGHCCRAFAINPRAYLRLQLRDRDGHPRLEEAADTQELGIILDMAIEISGTGMTTCRHFDDTTGNCGAYETRPDMCRRYPYGRECESPGCTWKAVRAPNPPRNDRFPRLEMYGESLGARRMREYDVAARAGDSLRNVEQVARQVVAAVANRYH